MDKEEDVTYLKNYITELDKQFDLGLFALSFKNLIVVAKTIFLLYNGRNVTRYYYQNRNDIQSSSQF